MTIDALTAADVAGCLDIYNHYVTHSDVTLEETPLTLAQYQARAQEITADYPFLVARDAAGRPIGFAYLSAFSPRSGYRCTADLSIYVHPDFRHLSLGSQMLAQIEPLAREKGITNLISIITATNIPSCRFHEAHGFLLEGELKHVAVKFGRDLGVRYYRKPL